MLSLPLAAPLATVISREAAAATGKMTLALHQNTSSAAGYRKSLEGWADDYKAAAAKNREARDVVKQFGLSLRIEFVRTSTFFSTLPKVS